MPGHTAPVMWRGARGGSTSLGAIQHCLSASCGRAGCGASTQRLSISPWRDRRVGGLWAGI